MDLALLEKPLMDDAKSLREEEGVGSAFHIDGILCEMLVSVKGTTASKTNVNKEKRRVDSINFVKLTFHRAENSCIGCRTIFCLI